MNSAELRRRFLEFFEKRGHKIIPSASLVPENDPTTLFTGSGMQPLIPYLLGQKHPLGTRIVDSQKSFRADDIAEVGDNRHTTFFEMLGNWSLGDYFKAEQLPWFFEFLTDVVKLDPSKLYVTVFGGDEQNAIPKDEESIALWKKLFSQKGIDEKDVDLGSVERGGELGMQGGRIFAYDAKKNWWSRSGAPENMPTGEPGGPDSEVFYEFADVQHDPSFGKYCHPNCDCGRFLEIGNSVFMEYKKAEKGFEKLSQRNVDFGGGLERITAASNNNPDVFETDLLSGVLDAMKKEYGWEYQGAEVLQKAPMRVVADHVRASVFMVGDGVEPSNTERGYILRRLLRRAIFHAYKFAPRFSSLHSLTDTVIRTYESAYPELVEAQEKIREVFVQEEARFMITLKSGEKIYATFGSHISGQEAFMLFTTHGFPIELTLDLAQRDHKTVDIAGFQEFMKQHQELSRTAAAGRFKGGLADTQEKTVRLHTAHHLLLAALQDVLGEHVKQRGSNITAERLRIDFSHGQKLTQEELLKVESLVREKIQEGLDMQRLEMKKEEALKLGAQMEFGVKYGDVVSVYLAKDREGNVFSKEFCGGPHVHNTKELGRFRIVKEEAVAAGVRRIRAVLE